MNALAKQNVADYLNEYFVSSFQKISNFRIVGKQKQGGNVAGYFCTPDMRVLHAIAGPVDAATMLREARWVVETWKLAQLQRQTEPLPLRAFLRKMHGERLVHDHGVNPKQVFMPAYEANSKAMTAQFDRYVYHNAGLRDQGRVHLLLAAYPHARLDQLYTIVFEKILNQKISTLPVIAQGGL